MTRTAPPQPAAPGLWGVDCGALAVHPLRLLLALFALYAVWTVPSLLPRWGASAAGFGLLLVWLALAALALPILRGRIGGPLGLTILVAVAVLVRFAALAMLWGHDAVGDPLIYRQIAERMIAGGPMAFPDTFTGVTFRALYPPLFPLVLTGYGRLFGLEQVPIWVLNLALDLAAAVLTVRIGERLGSRSAGLAAAWLGLIWPTFVLASPYAQKEPLVAVLVLGLALRLLRLRDGRAPTWGDGTVVGALGGLLALVQPGLLTLPLMFGLALLPVAGFRSLFALGLRSLPFLLLVMAPWWVRNALVLGHFVPLTTTGGIGLWIGNNPNASGNWMPLPIDIARLPELQQSAAAAAAAKAWIVANPVAMLVLNATKLFRSMAVEQFTLVRFGLLSPALPGFGPLLFPLLQGALFATLAGALLLVGRLRTLPAGRWLILLLVGLFAQLLGFNLWFEFAERHRYVVIPFLFLAIALALAARPAAATTTPPAV